MSLSDLASIATVVSSIAVLASLIYLALQMRQTERNQRALIQQGRAARTANSLLQMAQSEIAGPLLKAIQADDTMSPLEVLQLRYTFRAMMLGVEDTYLQHRQRLLGEREFEGVITMLRSLLANVGFLAMWRAVESDFEEGFRTFIEGLLRDEASRKPSPLPSDWKGLLAQAHAEISARGNCQ
jgi:hypothetical protein